MKTKILLCISFVFLLLIANKKLHAQVGVKDSLALVDLYNRRIYNLSKNKVLRYLFSSLQRQSVYLNREAFDYVIIFYVSDLIVQ